jgi:hypothetical protein
MLLCYVMLPTVASPGALRGVRQALSVAGETNYLAAENAARFQQELTALKQQPYQGDKLVQQFFHGIDSHRLHGETGPVNPGHFEEDPESKLSIDASRV